MTAVTSSRRIGPKSSPTGFSLFSIARPGLSRLRSCSEGALAELRWQSTQQGRSGARPRVRSDGRSDRKPSLAAWVGPGGWSTRAERPRTARSDSMGQLIQPALRSRRSGNARQVESRLRQMKWFLSRCSHPNVEDARSLQCPSATWRQSTSATAAISSADRPRSSEPTFSSTTSCSLRAILTARNWPRQPPFQAFRALRALPSSVRGPVDFSHGRQLRICLDCHRRRCGVQPFAITCLH